MSKVAFLTDSSCDIPADLAEKYGIEIACFPVNLDGKEYIERRDMTNDEFYQMMREASGCPTTAAITSLQWLEFYTRFADEGYTDVVHASINAGGSSTYANALTAAKMLAEERPGCQMKIRLVDSHTYSMVFGWYLCECARKVRNGAAVADAVLEMEEKFAKVEVCLAAYSLKQMKKSGRVSAAAAFAGELLGLRPIISLNDGVSKVEAKVRGDQNVMPAMLKWVESRVPDMKDTPYMIAYTASKQRRDELVKLCKKEFGHPPMCTFQLGCAVSASTGPDAVAVIFEGKPRRLCDYAPPLPCRQGRWPGPGPCASVCGSLPPRFRRPFAPHCRAGVHARRGSLRQRNAAVLYQRRTARPCHIARPGGGRDRPPYKPLGMPCQDR